MKRFSVGLDYIDEDVDLHQSDFNAFNMNTLTNNLSSSVYSTSSMISTCTKTSFLSQSPICSSLRYRNHVPVKSPSIVSRFPTCRGINILNPGEKVVETWENQSFKPKRNMSPDVKDFWNILIDEYCELLLTNPILQHNVSSAPDNSESKNFPVDEQSSTNKEKTFPVYENLSEVDNELPHTSKDTLCTVEENDSDDLQYSGILINQRSIEYGEKIDLKSQNLLPNVTCSPFENYEFASTSAGINVTFSEHQAASRLAHRLFHLDGFQSRDVPVHLCRRNEYNDLVIQEYLKLFDFSGLAVDIALRQWIEKCPLFGELPEREHLLQIFVKQFCANNSTLLLSDSILTLACAILLLNTDLHGNHMKKRLSEEDFTSKLLMSSAGKDYENEQLRLIYRRIAADPLFTPDRKILAGMFDMSPCAVASSDMPIVSNSTLPPAPVNPLHDVPSVENPREFLRGYILRKQVRESYQKKVAFGKRGWKLFFIRLCGLELRFYHESFQPPPVSSGCSDQQSDLMLTNIRIDHCSVEKASHYHKRPHVFWLQTRLGAEFLFQVGTEKEVELWLESIHFASALLSIPPSVTGNSGPSLTPPPSGYTSNNILQQIQAYRHFLHCAMQQCTDINHSQTNSQENSSSSNFKQTKSFIRDVPRYEHYLTLLQEEVRALYSYFASQQVPYFSPQDLTQLPSNIGWSNTPYTWTGPLFSGNGRDRRGRLPTIEDDILTQFTEGADITTDYTVVNNKAAVNAANDGTHNQDSGML